MRLIKLEPTDLASPGSSGAISRNQENSEVGENGESSSNILQILQNVASQGMEKKPEEVAMDSLNSAVAMPNTSFGSDNVARYVNPM